MIEVLSHEHIKAIRQLRNKSQKEWAELMNIDPGNLSRIESGELKLSPIYGSRLWKAIELSNISEFEIESIKTLIEYRKRRGI